MSRINPTTISNLYGHSVRKEPALTPGMLFPYHLGVELELESVRIPRRDTQWERWDVISDDSLRNGREFVFRSPYRATAALQAVKEFYERGVTSVNTARTSTHIHVNVTDLTVGDVRAMYVLSYALENGVYASIGAKRKYCGYCMPLSEMAPYRIRNFLTAENGNTFVDSTGGNNSEKYYGFNINSIRKHGTAELRYFPGGPSEDQLKKWMTYACDLRTAAVALGVSGIDAMESPDHFERMILEYFGEFGEELVRFGGIDAMWAMLQEVLAVFPEEETPRQSQHIVFLSDALVNFVGRHYFRGDHRAEHWLRTVKKAGSVSTAEFNQMLHDSSMQRRPRGQLTEEERVHQDSFGVLYPNVMTYMDYVRHHYWSEMEFGGGSEVRNRTALAQNYRNYLRDANVAPPAPSPEPAPPRAASTRTIRATLPPEVSWASGETSRLTDLLRRQEEARRTMRTIRASSEAEARRRARTPIV